ncbi:MAG: hypothetical protein HQM09_10515 [Candidatus Riflebacteria bacterium]|nr:hypothetical protein [Candidatus Riflebacteria bacterium]
MTQASKRLLLIHTTSERRIRYGSLFRSAGQTAPIGLAMLQAFAPDQIDLVDLQEQIPDVESLGSSTASDISACIVQAPQSWDEDKARIYGERLRILFPKALLVLGGRTDFFSLPSWDHTILGTGRVMIETLLSGTIPASRHMNTFSEDITRPLSVPEISLFDEIGYRSSVEKFDEPHAISVYRPWLGLLDRSRVNHPWLPPANTLENVLMWLKQSGFYAISFEGTGIRAEHLPQLAESLHRKGLVGAAAFDEATEVALVPLPLGNSLRRLWLRPSPWELPPDGIAANLARLKDDRITIGLRLHPRHAQSWLQSRAAEHFDRISFEDPGSWPKILLRRSLLSFYGRHNRFFSLLWGIRSAHDLICFLRGSYGLFEVLFERNI